MQTTVVNPWHRPYYSNSNPTLTYNNAPLLTYRNVSVFKNPAGSWDYVYNGMAITQRAGFRKDVAKALIDAMLAGECLLMSDRVRAHVMGSKP